MEIFEIVNIIGLLIGLAFGMIAQKTQFCFSGSIKDYIQTKSTRRGASVIVAMITAIIATTVVASIYEIDLTESTYYKADINYFAIILGGLMFGAGMMIADGCSNRSLIKFGQGDSRALVTILFIGIFAFATVRGFTSGVFSPILNNETLISWSSAIENKTMNIYFVIAILFTILFILTKSIKRVFVLWDGVIVGLLVAFAWYITGTLGSESMERIINLSSLSFVYPTGKSIELFMFYNINEFTFPIALISGVILGAFLMSFKNKKYSFGCTSTQNFNKVTYNMYGGALMGTGGILSIGCTVGQGLSGISSLAFASFLAIGSIFISGVITAIILNKYDRLPMCFIFEWEDTPPDYQI